MRRSKASGIPTLLSTSRFAPPSERSWTAQSIFELSKEIVPVFRTWWRSLLRLFISTIPNRCPASRRKRYVPERLHKRSFQLSVHTAQDCVGIFAGYWRPVWPRLNKRGEDLRDR